MSFPRLVLGAVLLSGTIAFGACSTSEAGPSFGSGGTGSGNTPGTGQGGTVSSVIINPGNGGPRQPVCENPSDPSTCSCVNIASIGLEAQYGATGDTTLALMTWLDTKSTAGAVARLTTHSPTLFTAAELDKYDILVLQHLTNGADANAPAWTFTAEEIEAVRSWVMEKGGAIFAMTGYQSSNTIEVDPTNQLIAFSGIQINKDDITGSGAKELSDCNVTCPPTSSICCSCWHGPQLITEWDFTHEIAAKGITAEPIFRGRSISPGDAQVVAQHRGKIVAVAKQVGNGRVFVFGDEWITYTSQWQDSADVGAANATNPCYDTTKSRFRNAANVFQVAQLWYNAIRWLQPAMTCFELPGVIL